MILHRVTNSTFFIEGLNIRMWITQGLLMLERLHDRLNLAVLRSNNDAGF
jgi:hypothetical protein